MRYVRGSRSIGRVAVSLLAAGATLVLWLALAPRAPALVEARLYAFVPDSANPHELRRQLESALAPVQVTLFGRQRDLRSAVSAQRPDLVLTRAPLLKELALSADVQGYAKGTDSEPFVLITRDRRPASLQELPGTTTGMVDMIEPHAMQQLAERLLAGRTPRTLRRATKLIDLLAMLRLGLADGVLVPRRVVPLLQAGTEMVLAITELPDAKVGLYAVHTADPAQRDRTRHVLKTLPAVVNHELGVDEWR